MESEERVLSSGLQSEYICLYGENKKEASLNKEGFMYGSKISFIHSSDAYAYTEMNNQFTGPAFLAIHCSFGVRKHKRRNVAIHSKYNDILIMKKTRDLQ